MRECSSKRKGRIKCPGAGTVGWCLLSEKEMRVAGSGGTNNSGWYRAAAAAGGAGSGALAGTSVCGVVCV